MKVLLINSDFAKNRGDRAIGEGLIELIKIRYPDAEITGISEMPIRDKAWFGIEFLDADVYSINPFKFIRLLIEARRSDIIYWGGGEYLKDYTNKASLWYWYVKIKLLRLANPNIYGAFQGIGPTAAKSSKVFVSKIVEMTKRFAVRDQTSYENLLSWGVDKNLLISSSDPAIFTKLKSSDNTEADLYEALNVSPKTLEDFIAIAPRNWFHYKKGKILPHRFRKLLLDEEAQSEDNKRFIENLVELIQHAAKKTENIFLVPMHMVEDVTFCEMLKDKSGVSNIHVISNDTITPHNIRRLLSMAKLMVGFRLHSNIIATSNYTPSINYYYVDKGRAYFEQIDQAEYCFAIEDLLSKAGVSAFKKTLGKLMNSLDKNSAELRTTIEAKRRKIQSDFERL